MIEGSSSPAGETSSDTNSRRSGLGIAVLSVDEMHRGQSGAGAHAITRESLPTGPRSRLMSGIS